MHRHSFPAFLAATLTLCALVGCNSSPSSQVGNGPGEGSATVTGSAAAVDQVQGLPGGIGPLPAVPVPATNPMTPDKIALGRQLFFDTRLSGSGQFACATCHNPQQSFTDGRPQALGVAGVLDRNAPTVINSAYYQTLFWDGRVSSLEEQAPQPLLNVREMNGTQQQVETLIQTDPSYKSAFQTVFGTQGTFAQVSQAIASFERTLVTGTSPFDRYARGDNQALSAQQKQGLALFVGRASCITCHNGPLFSDNQFHNLGVPGNDAGRFTVTGDPRDVGAFRTAGLRNVARTAPYFHNGSMAALGQVVAFYERGGGRDPNKTPLIRPLRLSGADQAALVAFLNSLSDD